MGSEAALKLAPASEASTFGDPAIAGPVELSVIVPTFNEGSNVAVLVDRLEQALEGIAWEVVFVDDDSPDHTADVVSELAQTNPRVRKIHRIGRRGLSSACIEGMLSSSAPTVAVMDGDLQHDEAALPAMLRNVREGADLVVGTRYMEGGSVGTFAKPRHHMSRLATKLSHWITGVKLSDPMSGFFMMRRAAFDRVVRKLSGIGFKILLDIAVTGKDQLRVAETPFTFRDRHAGESKLDTYALLEFAMLLLDKKIGHIVPPRFALFAAIGGIGVLVHFSILYALSIGLDVRFLWAQAGAAFVAMVSNYSLNNVITYRDRQRKGWAWFTGLLSFMLLSATGAFANVGIANSLYTAGTAGWALSAIAGILVGAVWNFAMASAFTWKK